MSHVVEHLLGNHEALSSNPSTGKKEKKVESKSSPLEYGLALVADLQK
jgi:hypothetical protein